MKLDTLIIFSKGFAYVIIGFFAPWTAALSQWMNSDSWPPRIAWVVLFAVSCMGAASNWLAFCSGSWKDYQQQRAADVSGQVQTIETKPKSANQQNQ